MSDITPIGIAGSHATAGLTRAGPGSHTHDTGETQGVTRGSDRVEISQLSQLLSKLNDLPDVRQELVDRVRSEIDAGTYESSDKIDAAINALADDLK